MRRLLCLVHILVVVASAAEAAPRSCESLATAQDFARMATAQTPSGTFAANFIEFSRWRERRDLPNSMARTPGAARPDPTLHLRALLPKLDLRSPDNVRTLGCALAQTADDALTRSAIEIVARKDPTALKKLALDYVPGDDAKQAEIQDVLSAVEANPIRR